jgi:hypothetical protein
LLALWRLDAFLNKLRSLGQTKNLVLCSRVRPGEIRRSSET